jgi:2-haloacid dehalogenase
VTDRPPPAVTFDVFSALIDSRQGGTTAMGHLARRRGWEADPGALYVDFDVRNKQLHAGADGTETFRELAGRAMADVHAAHALTGDPAATTDELLASIPTWPHWPDVPEGLRAVAAAGHRIALLSNIDDDLLVGLDLGGVEVATRITSQGARSYKPAAGIYDHARAQLGADLVHVPASARDVRGALEAGVTVVRVVRPGHRVDPDGPAPTHEVADLRDLPAVLAEVSHRRSPDV